MSQIHWHVYSRNFTLSLEFTVFFFNVGGSVFSDGGRRVHRRPLVRQRPRHLVHGAARAANGDGDHVHGPHQREQVRGDRLRGTLPARAAHARHGAVVEHAQLAGGEADDLVKIQFNEKTE